MMWYGMWFGMVLYGMVGYDLAWCSVAWYGMHIFSFAKQCISQNLKPTNNDSKDKIKPISPSAVYTRVSDVLSRYN